MQNHLVFSYKCLFILFFVCLFLFLFLHVAFFHFLKRGMLQWQKVKEYLNKNTICNLISESVQGHYGGILGHAATSLTLGKYLIYSTTKNTQRLDKFNTSNVVFDHQNNFLYLFFFIYKSHKICYLLNLYVNQGPYEALEKFLRTNVYFNYYQKYIKNM